MKKKHIKALGKRALRSSICPIFLQEKLLFYGQLGYWPNFENPQTFCEKLHHRKFHERDPRMVELSDKLVVRQHVKQLIGEKYLIPLVYQGKTIDADLIHSKGDQIVVKRNDDSGSIYIIEKNTKAEAEAAVLKVRQQKSGKRQTNEWWYDSINSEYLIEKKLPGELNRPNLPPLDFKFHIFNGENPFWFVDVIRRTEQGIEVGIFDQDFNPLYYNNQRVYCHGAIPMEGDFPEPELAEEMAEVALKLAKDFGFMRIDLYAANQQIYFGEYTVCSAEGRYQVRPTCFERKLGQHWEPVLMST